MKIIDFYKKHINIDPDSRDEDIGRALELTNVFSGKLDILYSLYSNTLVDLQNYRSYKESGFPVYFKSVSGNKVIRVGENYAGVIDLWYPREHCLFDLTGPILGGWIINDILEFHKLDKIEEIIEFRFPADTLKDCIARLITELVGTDIYGFYLGDPRNANRKRALKIRKFVIETVELPDRPNYRSYPLITSLKDTKNKETLRFSSYYYEGWNFYLSKELMESRLTDLENYWMIDYDTKVSDLDRKIETKEKELKNLKAEKGTYLNGIDEYRKKIHDLLWKNC